MRKGVLLVSDGLDSVQNYVLSVLVHALHTKGYESLHVSYPHITPEWLIETIDQYTPRYVVVNDLILLPDQLVHVKEKSHGVKISVRDVNTHPSFFKPDLFHLVKEYVSAGIKYLTRTNSIFQFRRLLEKKGIDSHSIKWAPDTYMVRASDPLKYGKEWGTPFKIGHYNRHMVVEENTTLQFMATAEFSFKTERETQFNMLSVNAIPECNEILNLNYMSEDLGVIELKLFPNLTIAQLEHEIRDLDILTHVSRVDTLFIDAIAASFNVPIVTSSSNHIFGKYSQADIDSPSQMANTYAQIFSENIIQRWWRAIRQKNQMSRFFKSSVNQWVSILKES